MTTPQDYPNLMLLAGRWVPAKPLKYPGLRGVWQRLRCKHDRWPEGFADWYCPKCGWES